MRFRPSFLGVFALILSCGPASEGPSDTAVVGGGTQAADAAAATPGAASELVGFSGARFAVLDSATGTVVFDALSRKALVVAGHAVRTPFAGSDMWMDVNLTGNDPRSKVEASADGRRILVRTERGVEAIDLERGGASLATADGAMSDAAVTATSDAASGAAMAPDGEAFATWNEEEIALYRIEDGARIVSPRTGSTALDSEPSFTWTPNSVSWTDGSGASLVDRASWRLQRVGVGIENAVVVVSKDGAVAAVYGGARPAHVEVWRAGATRPSVRVSSASVSNLIMDPTGSKLAWVEATDAAGSRAWLHTLDVASAAHARFSSKAAPCEIAPESLLTIEHGELRTDAECSPGCPSISRQPDLLAYDFANGRVLRHWMGEPEPPYNDELSVRAFAARQLAARYALADDKAPLPIVHHPSRDVVLVERSEGLRVAEVVSGDDVAFLHGSAGFSATSAHFWPTSGALVVASRGGTIAVWDAASGTQVWSTTP